VFADLDETIRQLLNRHVPLDLTEVDVSFEAPDREWSGRLSRPTVNCFLYDVRENLDLRAVDWEVSRQNGFKTAMSKRLPARIDATYQVTVWARAPEDEHRLLWRVLSALFRQPVLHEDLLQGMLRDQPYETHARVAQPSQARANPAELWQALDNRIRPALSYTVTVPLDSDIVFTSPMVFTRVTRLFAGLESGDLAADGYRITGRVVDLKATDQVVPGALVVLRETGAQSTTDRDGRFSFSTRPGPVTLDVTVPGRAPASRKVDVPSEEYDLSV
jgi:hypothetical protein